jgi:hypothetical protein
MSRAPPLSARRAAASIEMLPKLRVSTLPRASSHCEDDAGRPLTRSLCARSSALRRRGTPAGSCGPKPRSSSGSGAKAPLSMRRSS